MNRFYIIKKKSRVVVEIVNLYEDDRVTIQKSPIYENNKWTKFLPIFSNNGSDYLRSIPDEYIVENIKR